MYIVITGNYAEPGKDVIGQEDNEKGIYSGTHPSRRPQSG